MSTGLIARRYFEGEIGPAVDEVFVGISLPSDSVVRDVKIELQFVDASQVQAIAVATMSAVEGWILPVQDPDAGASFDALFDALVPKDTDSDVFDIDTGAADTTPFFEPGEIDIGALLDVGLRPRRIYHRRMIHSAAKNNLAILRDTESPFFLEWTAGGVYSIRLRKNFRVRQPSVMVFAMASPALDDTTTTKESALVENEWARVKYIDFILEQMLIHQIGLVETGAETPWEEASALMRKYLMPDVEEENAAAWAAVSYRYWGEARFGIMVPGSLPKGQIALN